MASPWHVSWRYPRNMHLQGASRATVGHLKSTGCLWVKVRAGSVDRVHRASRARLWSGLSSLVWLGVGDWIKARLQSDAVQDWYFLV
jgi:hypothetical protein